MTRRLFALPVLAALAACQPASENSAGDDDATATPAENAIAPVDSGENAQADAGDIRQLMNDYLARLAEDDFSAAQSLFPPGGAPDILDAYAPVTLREYVVGEAREEGAAGSLEATVPLRVSMVQEMTDTEVSLAGTVTLRRVDEVDGVASDQRRWRFVRSDLRPAG